MTVNGQVRELLIECPEQTNCSDIEKRASSLIVGKTTRADIEKAIEFLLLDQSIDRLSYEIFNQEDSSWRVSLRIVPKVKIYEIQFNVKSQDIDISSLSTIVPIKEGGFFEPDQLPEARKIVADFLNEKGFPRPSVEVETNLNEDGMVVKFEIEPGEGIVLSKINIELDNGVFHKEIEDYFRVMLNQNWNVSQARQISEQVEQYFFMRGFWSVDVSADLVQEKNLNIIEIKASVGSQYLFTFRGNKAFSHDELRLRIRDSAKSGNLEKIQDLTYESLKTLYETIGLYNIDVTTRMISAVDKNKVKRLELHVDIKENEKTRLVKVDVEGNQFISNEKFNSILSEECSVLVCRNYLDQKFLVGFSDILRKHYLSNGFVMANVSSPEIRNQSENRVTARYIVSENQRVELSRIELPGVPSEVQTKIISRLKNKQGTPLDVTSIESDMNTALDVLREEGYFFARISQINDANIVRYARSYQTARLVIPFEAGRKTYFDGMLVTGNTKTKSVVIEREVELKKGDLVTSKEINKLREKLISLGLFATVTITPFLTQSSEQDQYWLSFLVEVKERDFGLGEIAPGYRTDLGPKASLRLSYNNWQGMNRTIAFKTQANLRLDSDELDNRRAAEDRRLLEYYNELSFREPWLLGKLLDTKIEFDAVASYKRQRFFGFDADILRISPRITKQFGDNFTASVRYQYENIRQFDATETKDGDRFQIGGITPSVTLDLRDNQIIPTKGALFGLSWEFANPYFLSQSRENLEINFSKLTSRNRFYYPLGNLVLALSVSAGYQRNFADNYQRDASGNLVIGEDGQPLTVGYIPSIKVFRLDGVDNVRGFGDGEINRLPTGIDIGELRIQDTVTFVNYKFEPRYYFNDNVALGVFFDAGGLYVNQFVPLRVRTAAGVSAKLVTPVGSLDFDYGVKLRRRRTAGSGRESFGRFHLSIGSF